MVWIFRRGFAILGEVEVSFAYEKEELTMNFRFLLPTPALEGPYLAYLRDWEEHPGRFVPAGAGLGGLTYPQWLEKREAESREETVTPGLVPSSLYLLVDEEDRVLGALDLRHRLTVGLLGNGGHIGYGVAPSHRGHGYGAQMLRRALPLAAELGIALVLLTCLEENVPSLRTIERCGGVYEGSYTAYDSHTNSEKPYRRYWIPTTPEGIITSSGPFPLPPKTL